MVRCRVRNTLGGLAYLAVFLLGCHHGDYSDVGDLTSLAREFGCAEPENDTVQRACEALADFQRGGPVSPSNEERIYLGFTHCTNSNAIHVTTLGPLDGVASGVDAEHVPSMSMTRQRYDPSGQSRAHFTHGLAEERAWQDRMSDGTIRELPAELEDWRESMSSGLQLSRSDGISLLPEGPGIHRPWYSRAADRAPNAFARAGARDELLYLRINDGQPCIERAYRVRREAPPED